jgi:hypothetical protein
MTLMGAMLALAVSITPCDCPCDSYGSSGSLSDPYRYGPPVTRRFERWLEDQTRKEYWFAYCATLDKLWADYRAAGSTRAAFEKYKKDATAAKREYVYNDLYYVPIFNERLLDTPTEAGEESVLP